MAQIKSLIFLETNYHAKMAPDSRRLDHPSFPQNKLGAASAAGVAPAERSWGTSAEG
jgi:hypothetical protein